jgi:hypothetical protein
VHGADAAVWIESFVVAAAPLAVTLVGVKLQVDWAGNPEQLNDAVALNPVSGVGVSVRVVVALCPAEAVRLVGLAAILISTTIKATAVDEEVAEFVSPL